MKKDDLRLDTKIENREHRVRRASSLFMSSSVAIEDSIVESAEQNEDSDIGNQAPKRRHKSLPLSFIATNEESEEMPNIELTPSASVNLGAHLVCNFNYEAEIANNAITNDSLEVNFNSPGPRAPIRQASSRSLELIDDLKMDVEFSSKERYLDGEVAKKSSPISSPKAREASTETAEKLTIGIQFLK
jgi:hypothetical protein